MQLLRAVDVDERLLSPRRRGDEVAVPRRELLERREQLLAFGPARGSLDALLGLAGSQVEPLERGFLALLASAARSRAASTSFFAAAEASNRRA